MEYSTGEDSTSAVAVVNRLVSKYCFPVTLLGLYASLDFGLHPGIEAAGANTLRFAEEAAEPLGLPGGRADARSEHDRLAYESRRGVLT